MNQNLRWLFISGIGILIYFGVRHLYFQPKHDTGDKAPAFEAPLANGQPFSLIELRGSYVLLDFWGSWCGPCISSFPELRALYAEFSTTGFADASGFQIVSIAVEQDKSRWQRALERLQPSWQYQILDLSSSLRFFDSPIAELYGVKQLPTKVLIGPNGEVVSTNLSIEEIRTLLNEELHLPTGRN